MTLALNLNAGVIVSDQDDLFSNAFDLDDLLGNLNGLAPSIADADAAIALLKEMDNASARINGGGYLQASIPNQYLPAAFFAAVSAHARATTLVDAADIAYLENARDTPALVDKNLLTSQALVVGALVKEYGVSFAKTFALKEQDVTFGLSPKRQTVETFEYSATVANYNKDDLDNAANTVEESNFNMDLGVHATFGNWHAAAVLKNVAKQEYLTVSGRKLLIEPQLKLGGAYTNSWFRGELDLDMNPSEDLATQQDIQMARLGIEFDAFDWAQLRVGYRYDIEGTLDSTATAGIGFSPFGVMNLDIAALYGENETYGVAVQLGLNF